MVDFSGLRLPGAPPLQEPSENTLPEAPAGTTPPAPSPQVTPEHPQEEVTPVTPPVLKFVPPIFSQLSVEPDPEPELEEEELPLENPEDAWEDTFTEQLQDTENPFEEETDDGFQDFFEEEEDPEPKTLSGFVASVTGDLSLREDVSEEDLEPFNPLLDEEEEDAYTQKELMDKLKEGTKKTYFIPEGLSPDYDKRRKEAPATKEVRAAQREAAIRKKEAEKAAAKEFKSEFHRKPSETVTVNAAGETKTEAATPRKRLKKTGPQGKLDPKEIEFFKNMGVRSSRYSEGLRTTELLSGPLNAYATPKERRERLQKLERVFDSKTAYRSGSSFILNEKMMDTISFLALFRYAKHTHIAELFGESPYTARDRLYKLQNNGLVESRKIYAAHSIWFLTEAGLIVSGYDMKKVTDARITYSMFPHQFTVNHTAANLWGGKLNVLYLQDFPQKNRTNLRGEPLYGEQLTSETEILSTFSRMKLFENSSSFRPRLMSIMDTEFKKWADSDRGTVPSPEMVYGNEWMYTLFPPLSVKLAYHVPDLVVKRKRAPSGAPRSIAVEIEISNKAEATYRRTLQAYAADKRIYQAVVWVCKTIGTAKKLEKIGRELELIQSGRLKIVPILTSDGVFKGRDLWTL